MSKKVGVLGSGQVGQTLAAGFAKHGYQVMIGSDTSEKREELGASLKGIEVGTFADAARFGEILVFAVKGMGALGALKSAGQHNFKGKTVIDTTNPIAQTQPLDGVIQYYTEQNHSLMERLNSVAPEAHWVKAFSCVGAAKMVNPDFGGVKPTMFICGNHAGAKHDAGRILDQFGWEVEDMGSIAAAEAIESLAILWCIPGFLQNRWTYALKMLK